MSKNSLRDFFGKFSFLNILHFSAMACYYSFCVAFLTKCGYTSTKIGLILTINSVVSVIAQPLWGMLCDKVRSVRKVYGSISVVLTITVPFITLISSYYIHLFYIPLCIIAFYCPVNPLLDAWIVQGIKKTPGKTYGNIRTWGSIGYMVIMSVMGYISDIVSIEFVFYFFSFFSLLNTIVAFSIREEGVPEYAADGDDKRHQKNSPSIKRLLSNYYYVIFLVCIFLLHLPMTLKYSFLVPRIYSAGGTNTIFGLSQAMSALCEIPVFMFISKVMAKHKPQILLKLSLIIFLIHFVFLSLPVPPWSFLILQSLNGVGYSLFLVSSIAYIDSLSPPDLKTTAMTFATGFYGAASGIIGNLFAGLLIDSVGIIKAFLYGSIVVGFSILLFFILYFLGRKKFTEPVYIG